MAGRVLALVGLVGVLVLIGVLSAAGARKNAEINDLRSHGVPVVATVSSCRGQLGGSGSNPAGYTCWGTFDLAGHRHRVLLPGDSILVPGTRLDEVVAADDPSLVATPQGVADEHASWRVFVLPSTLLVAVAAVVAGALLRRRRRSARGRVALARLGASTT